MNPEISSPSPQQQQWNQNLHDTGEVLINVTFRRLIWKSGLVFVAIGLGLFFTLRNPDTDSTTLGLVIGLAIAALLVGALVVLKLYAGKSLIVRRDGLTMFDGRFIPWQDIENIGVFRAPQSGEMVQLALTPEGWETWQHGRGRGSRFLNSTNKALLRSRSVLISDYIDAQPHELADWLHQFATGSAA